MMFLKDVERCSIHGKKVHVTADMVCGLDVHGDPMTNAEGGPAMKLVTPEESGLGRGNTKCGNCEWGGGPRCLHPHLSNFKIDNEGGCCNAWTEPFEDAKGGMTVKEK